MLSPGPTVRGITLPRLFCLVSEADDISVLRAIQDAGVTGFQVRAKTLDGRELADLTRRVLHAVPDAVVVVNDRLDVALAAGAHGVHLGEDDLPVADARKVADAVDPSFLIGATCRDRADTGAAVAAGADYAGVGPIFATSSKAGLPDPLGPAALAGPGRDLPVYAIGGVTADNIGEVVQMGVVGAAVIGGIWSAEDPVRAARKLVGTMREAGA